MFLTSIFIHIVLLTDYFTLRQCPFGQCLDGDKTDVRFEFRRIIFAKKSKITFFSLKMNYLKPKKIKY